MKKDKKAYHHGNLAESLLNAVDDIASQFGIEAVTLRACAKSVGVSPSSAFRHYVDKRALLTAFATRALNQLSSALDKAKHDATRKDKDPFTEVCVAYVTFAIEKPAFFRAMWREDTIYSQDEHYINAANELSAYLKGGFSGTIVDDDPNELSERELLAWSAVHGLASLYVDGPISQGQSKKRQLQKARDVIAALKPAFH